MKPTQETISRIFEDAVKFHCREEQADFLDRICVGELRAVKAEVQSLLLADQRCEELGFSRLSTLVASPWSADSIPALIGPYRLLERIGEGGMGVVYKAEQGSPLRRLIALKVAKPSVDQDQVLSRFAQERQALAMMDHPYVATIFDAGFTDRGMPYFAMELVDGSPITSFCDKHRKDVSERLALFLDVCDALQHAHQKGIVHRDIKPNNVLVTVQDGRPVPKVIDFGLAKAFQSSLQLDSDRSSPGQIIGTLEYMSPEQAQLRNSDIDTRADVYSLGSLLYHLLAGKPPFESRRFHDIGLEELVRLLASSKRPSLSSSIDDSTELREICVNRRISESRLKAVLSGDLESVVMKALSVERAERYDTVTEFANDLRDYIDGRAVSARKSSKAYQLRKFVIRNRFAITIASCLFVLLLSGLLTSMYQWSEAVRQRVIADANRLADLANANTERSPNTSVLLALEAADLAGSVSRELPAAVVRALQVTTQNLGGIPLMGQTGGVTDCILSHDGCWMLPIGGKATHLWDLSNPQKLPHRVRQFLGVDAAAFSHDGKWLVTGDRTGAVKVWRLQKNGPLSLHRELVAHRAEINSVCICPRGRFIFSCDGLGSGYVWDLNSPITHTKRTRLDGHTARLDVNGTTAFGPDGRWLVIASRDHGVQLWDLGADGEPVGKQTLSSNTGRVDAVVVSKSGRWLAIAADKAWLWDLQLLNKDSSPTVLHPRDVSSIAISNDENWLVVGGMDGTAELWDLRATNPRDSRYVLRGHEDSVYSVAISSDNKWIVTGGGDLRIRLWNLAGQELDDLPLQTLATERYRIWDATSGSAQTAELKGHDGMFVSALAITNDGTRLVSADRGGGIRVWSLDSAIWRPTELSLLLDSKINNLELSPDGKCLVALTETGAFAWELENGLPVSRIDLGDNHQQIRTVAFSRDSRWLAASCGSPMYAFSNPREEDHLIRVWNLSKSNPDSGKPAAPLLLRGHTGQVTSFEFSMDNKTLVSGGADRRVLVWEIDKRGFSLAHELSGPPDHVHAVAISPDCKLIACAGRGSPMKRTPQPLANCFVWNLACDETPRAEPLPEFNGNTGIVAFSPDQQFLVYGGLHDELRVANTLNLSEYDVLQAAPGTLAVAFSRDGTLLAESGWQVPGNINLWTLNPASKFTPLYSVPRVGKVDRLRFDDSGRSLLIGDAKEPRALHISRGGDVQTAFVAGRSVDISPNGSWVVSSTDRELRFNDFNVGRLVRRAKKLVGREMSETERGRFFPDLH